MCKLTRCLASVPAAFLCLSCLAASESIEKSSPEKGAAAHTVPSRQQIQWQRLEFIAFAHFGINTFTDREWGEGNEDPKLFNPSEFDARQWARSLKEGGIKLLILTAKHHDGFCLWPSRYTEHSVKSSPWRDGKGDVVREVSEAIHEAGLKFGIYLSPWDRNQPCYGDSPKYNEYFKNQLRELLSNYGEITEVWFDGACGEGPNGKKQEYDWASYYAVVRELQPSALIAICGPDIRWVGNETGVARETEWSVQPPSPAQHPGVTNMVWWPAECDVSIRPGWFYHAKEDAEVKPLSQLLDIYYKSVGRNSVLLLNIPPDRRGLIHENDARRIKEMQQVLRATFNVNLARGASLPRVKSAQASEHDPANMLDGDPTSYWSAAAGESAPSVEIHLVKETRFNRSMLQEQIELGQRIEDYRLEAWDDGKWRTIAKGTTVGYKKLDRFPDITTSRVRLTITRSRGAPAVSEFGLFLEPATP